MRLFDEQQNKNITIAYDQRPCPYHKRIADIVASLASPEKRTLLDVGCGAGNTLAALEQRGIDLEYTIADIDPECLRITQAKVCVSRAHRLGGSGDLDDIDERFDFIVLSHVLQYDESPARTMRKLLSMLRPEGVVIVATPNPAAPQILLNNLLRRDYVKGSAYVWDRSVFMSFLTHTVGGDVVDLHGDYVPLPILTRYPVTRSIEKLLVRVFPWFTFSIIAVVENRAEEKVTKEEAA